MIEYPPELWLFLFFFVFLVIGYESDKPSGGFFMIFSGLALIGTGILLRDSLLYVNGLTTPFGALIAILGGRKAFFVLEQSQENGKTVTRWKRR